MKKWNTYKILYDSDKKEIAKFLYKSQSLNKSDLVLDEAEYNEIGDPIQRFVYRYNERGTLIESIEYDSVNDLVERAFFELDEEDEIIRVTIDYSEGEKEIKEYEFINNDKTEKVTISNSDDEIIGYELYHNDGNGNIVEEIIFEENIEISKYQKKYLDNKLVEESFYSNAKIEYTDTFFYAKDKLIKRQRKGAENGMIETEENGLDINGNIVTKTYHNHIQNYQIVEINEYDSNGKVLLTQSKMNGRLVFSNKCTYDKNKFLIAEEILELDWDGFLIKNEKTISEFDNNAT